MLSSLSSQTTLRSQAFRPFEETWDGSEWNSPTKYRIKRTAVSETVHSLVSRALGMRSAG